MLYLLHQLFFEDLKILRIFKSITIRASISFFLALLFVLILGKPFIAWLKKKKYGDTVREEGPQSHFSKSGFLDFQYELLPACYDIAIQIFAILDIFRIV